MGDICSTNTYGIVQSSSSVSSYAGAQMAASTSRVPPRVESGSSLGAMRVISAKARTTWLLAALSRTAPPDGSANESSYHWSSRVASASRTNAYMRTPLAKNGGRYTTSPPRSTKRGRAGPVGVVPDPISGAWRRGRLSRDRGLERRAGLDQVGSDDAV